MPRRGAANTGSLRAEPARPLALGSLAALQPWRAILEALTLALQFDFGRIALVDGCELRFLELRAIVKFSPGTAVFVPALASYWLLRRRKASPSWLGHQPVECVLVDKPELESMIDQPSNSATPTGEAMKAWVAAMPPPEQQPPALNISIT